MWSMSHVVPDVWSSTCTETEKFVQSRVQHLENSWGTHHQKQVTLHWHKEIISVRTAASGQQLRYPSPEASHLALTRKLVLSRLEHLDNSWGTHHQKQVTLHWHKEMSSVELQHVENSWGMCHEKQVPLHSHKEISSVQTASPGQQLRYPHQKSGCTQSKKLIQSRLQHVDNSWGTHHQSLAPCTHTKKLVQYRLHHLVNSWGTLTRSHVALSQRN